MSTADTKRSVEQLQRDLTSATASIDQLSKSQQQTIQGIQTDFESKFGTQAVQNFSRLLQDTHAIGCKLITEAASKNLDVEGVSDLWLDSFEDQLVPSIVAVQTTFTEMQSQLAIDEKRLMKEETKAVEQGTAMVGKLESRISGAKTNVNLQIQTTLSQINASEKEKSDAETQKSKTEKDLAALEEEIRKKKEKVNDLAIASGSTAAVGVASGLLAIIFPPIGIPLAVGAIGASIGTGIGAACHDSDRDKLIATSSTTQGIINGLKSKIDNLRSNVLGPLHSDNSVLGNLQRDLDAMKRKAQDLTDATRSHTRTIVTAKNGVGTALKKVGRVNSHLSSSEYAETSSEIADALEEALKILGSNGLKVIGGTWGERQLLSGGLQSQIQLVRNNAKVLRGYDV